MNKSTEKERNDDFTSLICLYVLMRSTLSFRRGASSGSRYAVIVGIIFCITNILIRFHDYKSISFLYNITYSIGKKKVFFSIKNEMNWLLEIHRFRLVVLLVKYNLYKTIVRKWMRIIIIKKRSKTAQIKECQIK